MFLVSSNVRLVRERLKSLPKALPKPANKDLKSVALAIVKRMKKKGKRVRYPITWDSVIQMKAFFASRGFGGGIPHRSKGAYIKGWKVTGREGRYDVVNDYPGAKYVAGNRKGIQSKVVAGRWPVLAVEAEREIKKLPTLIRRTMRDTMNKKLRSR